MNANRFNVNTGDLLVAIPLWNKSERKRKLPDQVEVKDWVMARSQTGVMVKVETIQGEIIWLDLGWFGYGEF